MSTFGIAYLITAAYTSNRLDQNSKTIAEKQTFVVRSLQESLGAIRDVLLDGTQKIYKNLYKKWFGENFGKLLGKTIILIKI